MSEFRIAPILQNTALKYIFFGPGGIASENIVASHSCTAFSLFSNYRKFPPKFGVLNHLSLAEPHPYQKYIEYFTDCAAY
ncbi:hypothetical protein EXU57_11405 [Segetibacter sp. 3557_3]|nr:hypothetical protein EXU57_11405 [Segetibacter sp. 3557_3]